MRSLPIEYNFWKLFFVRFINNRADQSQSLEKPEYIIAFCLFMYKQFALPIHCFGICHWYKTRVEWEICSESSNIVKALQFSENILRWNKQNDCE